MHYCCWKKGSRFYLVDVYRKRSADSFPTKDESASVCLNFPEGSCFFKFFWGAQQEGGRKTNIMFPLAGVDTKTNFGGGCFFFQFFLIIFIFINNCACISVL